ncbi:hypothetical protein Y032_0413g1004 [Ancylostoma ceylanicum]|nr:hypothetical protein Y032_0413g1004 [Ancylostoma ceylanicum]
MQEYSLQLFYKKKFTIALGQEGNVRRGFHALRPVIMWPIIYGLGENSWGFVLVSGVYFISFYLFVLIQWYSFFKAASAGILLSFVEIVSDAI